MQWLNNELTKLVIRNVLGTSGAWFVSKGFLTNDETDKLMGALAVLVGILHHLWTERHDIIAEVKSTFNAGKPTVLPAVKLLIGLCIFAVFTGCTIMNTPQGKVLSTTTRGLYIDVATTSSSTGTPDIKFGLGSQTVMIVPTSTNGAIAIPNVTDSSTIDQTVNPFSTSGNETFAAGNYQVNQTNGASATQPITPK